MAEDPWAEFRVQSAAPAGEDPWAEFRATPAAAPDTMGFATRAQREQLAPMSAEETARRGVAKGFLANFADEANAAAAASPLPGAAKVNAVRTGAPNVLDVIAGAARIGAEKLAPSVFGDAGSRAYDARLEEERAQDARAMQDHPVISVTGQVAGALANPVGAVVPTKAKTALEAAKAGAKVAAPIGALYGFGEGEGGAVDRALSAAKGAAIAGPIGGVAGSIFGRVAAPGSANAVVDAAGRLSASGTPVDVSKVIATDSGALQQIGMLARNVPLAGDPLVNVAKTTTRQLGEAVQGTAANAGGASMEQAGDLASRGIRNWITGASKASVTKAYDAVDNAVNPAVTTDLVNTRNAVADIVARRQNARISGDSKAVNEVLDAVQAQGGLNYQGLKDLRSSIGEMLNNGILPEGMKGSELKRIYGALTEDLRTAVSNAGGQRGLALWERANQYAGLVAERRENLARLVGANGQATPAQVFDRLKAAAGGSSRADTALLAQARKVMGSEWEEVVSGIVGQMGKNQKGEFSPQIFLNQYREGMSDAGRKILFDGVGNLRQSLDDIATISTRFHQLQQFANPSGSGRVVVGGGLGTWIYNEPVTAVAAIVGGNVASRILASPATASSMAKWMRAYEVAVRKPTAATVASLQQSSRNFASTVGDKIGAALDPSDLLRSLTSQVPARANGEGGEVPAVGQ